MSPKKPTAIQTLGKRTMPADKTKVSKPAPMPMKEVDMTSRDAMRKEMIMEKREVPTKAKMPMPRSILIPTKKKKK